MKTVEGLVCTATFDEALKQERLYGPNVGGSEFDFQNFTSNGLVPFPNSEEGLILTNNSLRSLDQHSRKLGITMLGLAEARITLAERNLQEINQLKYAKSCICSCF